MGCCLSKKCPSVSQPCGIGAPQSSATIADICSTPLEPLQELDPKVSRNIPESYKEADTDAKKAKKNIAKGEKQEASSEQESGIARHRKSQDKISSSDKKSHPEANLADGFGSVSAVSSTCDNETSAEVGNSTPINGFMPMRTSSFTKEEVDAILIQCGKLSRSNSAKASSSSSAGRKHLASNCDDADTSEGRSHDRQRRRSRSSSHGRRRTPSRERDQQPRSNSKERTSSSGRRVSRSPGRRHSAQENSNASSSSADTSTRPARMVSVPATVTSKIMEKSNKVTDVANDGGIEKIAKKRNVSEVAVVSSRGAASPSSKSPAKGNACKGNSDNQQQQSSLSRSSSRKAEQSPYRRNALSEIDSNLLGQAQVSGKKSVDSGRKEKRSRNAEENAPLKETSSKLNQKSKVEMKKDGTVSHGSKNRRTNRVDEKNVSKNGTPVEVQKSPEVAGREPSLTGKNIVTTIVALGSESSKPQKLPRSNSSGQNRDLDFNSDSLGNSTSSYAALLLEDIQHFHQKNNISVTLPTSVNKASIVEAVPGIHSTTSSGISCSNSEERIKAQT